LISQKAQEIRPFIVMDVLEKAQELERAGERIIHLEVGEPDLIHRRASVKQAIVQFVKARPTIPTAWA